MGCLACAACCTYMMVEIGVDHDGYYEWLRAHGGEITSHEGRPHVRLPQPCMHLDHGRCKIYARRPQMCREYLCESARKYG